MITSYPVHLERKISKSSDPKTQNKCLVLNKVIENVETWINSEIEKGTRGAIKYSTIEKALKLPEGLLGVSIIVDHSQEGFIIDPKLKVKL